jgi:hypothetical protein
MLQSNTREEYKSNEFNIFFQHNDIKRKFTIVDTPQQNWVLELRNRTLVGGVLTMLQ